MATFAAVPNLAISMILPIMPVLAAGFGTRASSTTAAMTVYMSGLALAIPLIGPWSDRVGRRPPLLAGLQLFLCGSLVSALTNDLTIVLAGRFIQSLGAAAVFVAGRAVIGDLYDEVDAARSLSAMMVIVGMEPIAGPVLGAVLSHLGGCRLVFVAQAVLAAVLLLVSALAFPESRTSRARAAPIVRTPYRSYGRLLRDTKFMALFWISVFSVVGHSAWLASAPLVMAHAYGLSRTSLSIIAAVVGFAIPGGALLNRLLLRKYPPISLIVAAVPLLVCLTLLHVFFAVTSFGDMWELVGLTLISTLVMSVVYSNAIACALALVPGLAGSAAAMLGAGTFATGTLASLAVGAFYDRSARIMCELTALGLLATGLCIYFSLYDGAKRASGRAVQNRLGPVWRFRGTHGHEGQRAAAHETPDVD